MYAIYVASFRLSKRVLCVSTPVMPDQEVVVAGTVHHHLGSLREAGGSKIVHVVHHSGGPLDPDLDHLWSVTTEEETPHRSQNWNRDWKQ